MSEATAGHAVIILAAGTAARMGTPKQLLDIGGQPMVRRAALTAVQSGADLVVVVIGARADEVRQALANVPVAIVVNERWRDGVGGSIQAGLQAAESYGVASVTLMLADQPLISAGTLRALAARRQVANAPIVAAKYAGTVGVPAVFAREVFGDLYALTPDQGCKPVIRAHSSRALFINCPEASVDVDTPADYARIVRLRV